MNRYFLSRGLVGGQVAFAAFLVDRYCLGVKDAFCGFMAYAEYFEKLHERVAATGDMVTLKPAAARKLVEGAVEYAKNLGGLDQAVSRPRLRRPRAELARP